MGGGNLANPNKKRGFAISGILYPLLILTLFLVVQMLFMLQTRKNVLDKARTELADSINSSNQVYTNEELSTLIQEQQAKTKQLDELITNIKNNTYTKEELNKMVDGTVKEYSKTIDLTNSKYNTNTWYPVVTTVKSGAAGGYRRVRCVTHLGGSGKPSWGTHASGFSVSVDLFSQVGSWGNLPARTLVLANEYYFVSGSGPVGYKNYNEPGTHIFYLRGGGIYNLYTDFEPSWNLYTSKHNFYDEYPSVYVEPLTTNPGITASSEVIVIK